MKVQPSLACYALVTPTLACYIQHVFFHAIVLFSFGEKPYIRHNGQFYRFGT